MSPAKVSTQGRNAPVTMVAPAATPASPAIMRQLSSRAARSPVPAWVVMLSCEFPQLAKAGSAGRWRGRGTDAGPGRFPPGRGQGQLASPTPPGVMS